MGSKVLKGSVHLGEPRTHPKNLTNDLVAGLMVSPGL